MLKLIHRAMIPGLPSPDKNEKAECEKSRQAGMLAHPRVRLQNKWIAVDVGRTRWCWVESGLSENMAEWKVFLPIKVLWRVGWDGWRCWQRSGAGDKGHKSRSRTPTKLDNLDNVNRAESHIIWLGTCWTFNLTCPQGEQHNPTPRNQNQPNQPRQPNRPNLPNRPKQPTKTN